MPEMNYLQIKTYRMNIKSKTWKSTLMASNINHPGVDTAPTGWAEGLMFNNNVQTISGDIHGLTCCWFISIYYLAVI